MRIIGLLFLCLLAFVVTAVWKFPAAGVLPHVNIEPIKLSGVSGSIWSGSAQQITPPPPALPINNANWKFKPATLLSGSAGAEIDFEVLGGNGEGTVTRDLDGNIMVNDGKFRVPAANLEQFLPFPVAKFAGVVLADIEELELENNLLKRTQGKIIWSNSAVTSAMLGDFKLGQVAFDIVPENGGELHLGKLSNKDGELELKGEISLDQKGNFKTDIQLKPTPNTPAKLNGLLRGVGPQQSDGSYRIKRNGNINNLM